MEAHNTRQYISNIIPACIDTVLLSTTCYSVLSILWCAHFDSGGDAKLCKWQQHNNHADYIKMHFSMFLCNIGNFLCYSIKSYFVSKGFFFFF